MSLLLTQIYLAGGKLRLIKGVAFICLMMIGFNAIAADYQWSVPIDGKDDQARAFLWIPPNCAYARGVVIASQVILEKQFCDNTLIRQACAKEGLGIIILFRGPLTSFYYKQGDEDKKLQKILDDLAAESGYAELSVAPLFTVGHSGGGIGAWNIGYWNPGRVFGILTLHSAAMTAPPIGDPKARTSGIPVMAVSGEYEMWTSPKVPLDQHWRWLRGDLLDIRGRYEEPLVCEVVQPGAGHFNFDDHLAKLTAMFLQKAAHYRIPQKPGDGKTPVKLNHLDEDAGWLTDITFLTPSKFPPTSAKLFKGDKSLAFWSIDEEMAKAIEAFPALYGGKTDQRVTFVEDGKPLPATWITELKFEPVDDGMTFKLSGDFLMQTPEGVAGAGKPLGHSSAPFKFRLIGGWGGGGQQTGPNTFRIRFDHFGISRFTNNIQVMVYNDGDAEYKYAEQAGQVKFPEKNTIGKIQVIKFPKITEVSAGITSVKLNAVSDAGYPVSYFVRSGPAEIDGDQVNFTTIPPRAKYPVKVTLVAYQWGRSVAPLVQSAEPVEQTFYIQKK
jgi:hypothetical protein